MSQTVVCILGATGEFFGSVLVKEACRRASVRTNFLVRRGAESDPKKQAKIVELVSLGANVVYGDASDIPSLIQAFEGTDIVISSLGGWGDLLTLHNNVYEACKVVGVRRVVPAQFGFDCLSFPDVAMDDYFKLKRSWNEAAINSGIPYTIVSQGAFSEWFLSSLCPVINHTDRTVFYVGSPDIQGWVTTSMGDTARFTLGET
jgi:uncharacterized protein YbjT (DUF2867 family)